jgi:tRNA-dihydrouridine synthase 1
MVGASDLPFRMLCRRHGVDAAYTQMLLAADVVAKPGYADEMLRTCEGDRPLIVQLAGDNPEVMLQAAKLVQRHADAVDINLGCPQEKAKLLHYGSYLCDKKDWPLVYQIVNTLARNLSVPTFCKIRLQDSEDATTSFAKLLQDAGCALLTVHGRRRGSERKRRVGPADLGAVSRVVETLSIPVITNGNVETHADVHACLTLTGAHGAMSGEGLLRNPAIFSCHCSESRIPLDSDASSALTPADRLNFITQYLDLIDDTKTSIPSLELSMVNVQNHIGWLLGKEGHGERSLSVR